MLPLLTKYNFLDYKALWSSNMAGQDGDTVCTSVWVIVSVDSHHSEAFATTGEAGDCSFIVIVTIRSNNTHTTVC